MRPASYHTGFAPRDGRPRFPELWNGCVGAWSPSLGPSGLALRDWSGRRNDGTLTNMTANDDWLVSQGRYGLDFRSPTSSVVTVASSTFAMSAGTVSIWFNDIASVDNSNNDYILWAQVTSSSNRLFLEVQTYVGAGGGTARLTGVFGSSSLAVPSITHTKNTWNHACLVWSSGQLMRLYQNGILIGTTSATYTTQSQTATAQIGNYSTGSLSFSGLIDDVRRYDRALSENEIRILAQRRGVAYEIDQPQSYDPLIGLRRRRILTGQV